MRARAPGERSLAISASFQVVDFCSEPIHLRLHPRQAGEQAGSVRHVLHHSIGYDDVAACARYSYRPCLAVVVSRTLCLRALLLKRIAERGNDDASIDGATRINRRDVIRF